jgi:hypothetical protein
VPEIRLFRALRPESDGEGGVASIASAMAGCARAPQAPGSEVLACPI